MLWKIAKAVSGPLAVAITVAELVHVVKEVADALNDEEEEDDS